MTPEEMNSCEALGSFSLGQIGNAKEKTTILYFPYHSRRSVKTVTSGNKGRNRRPRGEKNSKRALVLCVCFLLRYFMPDKTRATNNKREGNRSGSSSISSSRNPAVNKEEPGESGRDRDGHTKKKCFSFSLLFVKSGTRTSKNPKMNYLPNHWRRRVALHWPQAVARLRCSARSTVVYHPAVGGTL